MKIYLTFGAVIAVANALLTLGMYFLGFHSDISKVQSGQWIGIVLSAAIGISGIVMGTKARRAEVPAEENFGYGRALGAGVMVTLFAALFGIVVSALYFGVINPGFSDLMAEFQLAEMEKKGMPPEAQEGAEKVMRFMMKPAVMAIFGFFGTMFWGTIISLVAAAFLKRPARDDIPPALA